MEYSSANLISFFYTHWKKLMVVPFLAMVVAVVFSGPQFIKPLFESQVILFPSTTNSVSKALLPQTNGYGDEVRAALQPAWDALGITAADIGTLQ